MVKPLSVSIAIALMGSVFAQIEFDKEVCDITLLQTTEVKTELKVTQAQRAKMNSASSGYNAVAKKIEDKMRKGQQPTEAEQKQMRAAFDKMRIGVLNVLTAVQIKRLREISLQTAGLLALTDPAVTKKVGLSASQVSKVKTYLKDSYQQAGDLTEAVHKKLESEFKGKNPKTDAEKRRLAEQYQKRLREEMKKIEPKLTKIQTDGRARIMAVLSAGQRTIWNSLLGKPFNP
ncbi:MAG: hypothetical protein JNK63_07605 [Chthonomonas sp.]|nr:hypothetical protein [Chthonomonas sp.]